ncbi:hypothetical protein LTSEHVI_1715 [Salmonella enterica subsp. enterica serovar Hvittingfoss str. A4-620]|nr:hypothetical protein LTSEHVI_1715 [Salmonella enterica subsp. enterica serovar Hvittingfoss str. A4-620]
MASKIKIILLAEYKLPIFVINGSVLVSGDDGHSDPLLQIILLLYDLKGIL